MSSRAASSRAASSRHSVREGELRAQLALLESELAVSNRRYEQSQSQVAALRAAFEAAEARPPSLRESGGGSGSGSYGAAAEEALEADADASRAAATYKKLDALELSLEAAMAEAGAQRAARERADVAAAEAVEAASRASASLRAAEAAARDAQAAREEAEAAREEAEAEAAASAVALRGAQEVSSVHRAAASEAAALEAVARERAHRLEESSHALVEARDALQARLWAADEEVQVLQSRIRELESRYAAHRETATEEAASAAAGAAALRTAKELAVAEAAAARQAASAAAEEAAEGQAKVERLAQRTDDVLGDRDALQARLTVAEEEVRRLHARSRELELENDHLGASLQKAVAKHDQLLNSPKTRKSASRTSGPPASPGQRGDGKGGAALDEVDVLREQLEFNQASSHTGRAFPPACHTPQCFCAGHIHTTLTPFLRMISPASPTPHRPNSTRRRRSSARSCSSRSRTRSARPSR